jgi:hypothetical protein
MQRRAYPHNDAYAAHGQERGRTRALPVVPQSSRIAGAALTPIITLVLLKTKFPALRMGADTGLCA